MLSGRRFFLLQEGSHDTSPGKKKKKTSHVTLCLKFAGLSDISDHTATSRIVPTFKTLILWVSTKLEASP